MKPQWSQYIETPLYHNSIPMDAGVSVHTGFPNPAIDASLKELDLNQLLISHSAASYFMRVSGGEWQPLGIFDGDIVIIDRAVTSSPNDLVAWWQHDTFAVSHLHSVPKNAVIFGTVTSTIHQFKETGRRIEEHAS